MLVVINESLEGLVMGKIIVVLIHNGSVVYFVTKKNQALILYGIGVHSLAPIQGCYCCIKQDDLVDIYPLPEYVNCCSTPFFLLQ